MDIKKYYAERNIYGRHGKLFLATVDTDGDGNQTLSETKPLQWLTNVTEVSANMNVARMEVRRAGDRMVHHKAGEVTGEGNISFDKVNSDFETFFIDYLNRRTSDGFEMPSFEIHISLEDPSLPGITFGTDELAISGHEEIILKGVRFWSMPLGYTLSDMLSRQLDFTFSGVVFGGTDGANKIVDPDASLITRLSD